MIKMDHVVMDAVGGDDHVSDILGVERNFHLKRIFDRPDRRDGVNGGAYTANPLRVDPGVTRIAAPSSLTSSETCPPTSDLMTRH